MSYLHPAIEAYNRARRAIPTSDLDGSLRLSEIRTYAWRREVHGADSPDLIDSACASWVTFAGPKGEIVEYPDGGSVDTGKSRFWHPSLPEIYHAQSSENDWCGIWIMTGEGKSTGGAVWRGSRA